MELSDNEPEAKLDFGGVERPMNRFNSALFRHLARFAMYDHIFVQFDNDAGEGDDQFGAYIFRQNSVYETLERFMIENEFPVHFNINEVAECDADAFERTVAKDMDDLDGGVPEGWE